ncbi:Uma2 family endonuclease [Novipirellula sp. SH528]|uniref:Uma2 family endonuclease n=1 Tax=Novipirellula sp. SH528 TaxID=3454466 RepID=UPI003F9FAE09
MSTTRKLVSVSVEDYLAGESTSDVKYEYVDGRIDAMAGGTNAHNRIASRILIAFGRQLDASPCEAFNSDTKIRIQRNSRTYFYYPDVSVICQSNPDSDTFQDQPVVIVEVVSESTRRVDEGEKREHYLSISTLSTYILLEQDRRAARVYTRGADGEFSESLYVEPDSTLFIPAIDASLRFADIFPAE